MTVISLVCGLFKKCLLCSSYAFVGISFTPQSLFFLLLLRIVTEECFLVFSSPIYLNDCVITFKRKLCNDVVESLMLRPRCLVARTKNNVTHLSAHTHTHTEAATNRNFNILYTVATTICRKKNHTQKIILFHRLNVTKT